MGLSIDDILAKFPAKTTPHMQGEPNYASINDMVQILYSNTASLTTTFGGKHSHIGCIMTPILYATLSNTPYDNLDDPGQIPILPANASAAT
jgi:hypothetical protein